MPDSRNDGRIAKLIDWCFAHQVKVQFHKNSITEKQEILVSHTTRKTKRIVSAVIPDDSDDSYILFQFLILLDKIDPAILEVFRDNTQGETIGD